jgi:hypothetical protein
MPQAMRRRRDFQAADWMTWRPLIQVQIPDLGHVVGHHVWFAPANGYPLWIGKPLYICSTQRVEEMFIMPAPAKHGRNAEC